MIKPPSSEGRSTDAAEPPRPYVLGGRFVDCAERRVAVAGCPVELTATEYRTLADLSTNAGRVLTYEHLLQRVWGVEIEVDMRHMRTVISTLRSRLGDKSGNPTFHLHRASRRLPHA